MKVLVAQLCLTLGGPTDCHLPGSAVHGILQASTRPPPIRSRRPAVRAALRLTAARAGVGCKRMSGGGKGAQQRAAATWAETGRRRRGRAWEASRRGPGASRLDRNSGRAHCAPGARLAPHLLPPGCPPKTCLTDPAPLTSSSS